LSDADVFINVLAPTQIRRRVVPRECGYPILPDVRKYGQSIVADDDSVMGGGCDHLLFKRDLIAAGKAA
jgi:hypothetical protein